jgi:hypothetical protein
VSPNCLYDHLDDEQHSDLIGYAFDGYPIYGAHGYANPDGSGGIIRMRSSYQLRAITARTTLPNGTVLPANQYGPAIGGQYPLGAFLEDYAYVAGSGDLDAHNGRFCITPEYPAGTYAYFVTLNEQYEPAFPYVLGPQYYGTVQPGNTGPNGGHNTIPGAAVEYTGGSTGLNAQVLPAEALSPNPTLDRVQLSAEQPLRLVRLLDATGRCALQQDALSASVLVLDLGALPAGLYTVEAHSADGSVRTGRVVKQ